MAVASGVIDAAIRMTAGRVRIIAYHGVSPFGLDPELFARQLAYVARRFESFWVSELPALFEGRRRPRRPPIVLTFDDGLRSFAQRAVPALRANGLKATVYVVSDLLDGESMLWTHELTCRLLLSPDGALPPGAGPLPAERGARMARVREFVSAVKQWNDVRRTELMAALRAAWPRPAWEPWMRDLYQVMSREELSALPADIVEVGSHTRTHPILPRLSDERAREEIQGSRPALESILGRPVESFCYPNGDLSPRDLGYVREAYAIAVGGEEGLASGRSDRHALPRISEATDMTTFAWRMVRPYRGPAA
jgi:peptidoglycan/xylan/chitin deacetylase (PgdA/CDA1 family)